MTWPLESSPCVCGWDRPCPKHPEPPSTGNNLFSPDDLAPENLASLSAAVRRFASWVRENRPEDMELLAAIQALEAAAKRVGAST